jgi:hypothetical protein
VPIETGAFNNNTMAGKKDLPSPLLKFAAEKMEYGFHRKKPKLFNKVKTNFTESQ